MAKAKSKTKTRKVKRDTNGQILKGSCRLKGSGRPKGSKSTGKQIKSAGNNKRAKSENAKKSVRNSKKSIKSAKNKTTSTSKGKKSQEGVIRNRKGQVQYGSAGLPGAGRKLGNSKSDRLEAIIAEVSAEPRRKEWLKDLIRRSYKSESLSIALLNKLYPSMKSVEISTPEPDEDSKREAAKIRSMMKRRCQPVGQELANLRKENAKLRITAGLKNENQQRMENR